MQNACMHACSLIFLKKHGKFEYLAHMYFERFPSSSKSLFQMSRLYRKRKVSRTSIVSATTATTTSELLTIVVSLTFRPLSSYLLTSESAWVALKLMYHFFAMPDKIVRLSVNFKINQTASKNLQNVIHFSSAKFWKQTTKPGPNF